ncbi:MAG: tetratricopeptide repeat protein [Candidatus Riflebacteria bacterium]|nr:tetratricopeptide repeat protein [Candidatus Riflebacteria bacterium]
MMNRVIRFCLIFFLIGFYYINSCCAKDFSYMGSQDKKFQELFYEALELEQKGKYQEAIKSLEEALKINPDQMQALGELCICCLEVKDGERLKKAALKGLQVAQDINSEDNIGRFYHNLAGYYHMNEQYEQAIKYFKLALHNKPYYTADYAPLGYCYYKTKNYDKAIECYSIIQNEKMINEVRKVQRAEIPLENSEYMAVKYILDDNNELLESECKKIIKLDSNNVLGLIGMARVEAERNNYSEAIKLGEKTLPLLDKKDNKKNDYLYPYLYLNILNKSYYQLENFDKSSNYTRLYLIATYTSDAKEALANGNVELALSCYEKALSPDNEIDTEFVPYNYMALDGIIDLLFYMEKPEEAKKYIQKGIKICKDEKNTDKLTYYIFQVGRYYTYLKQYDKAIKYYNKAYEQSNDLDEKYCFKIAAGGCWGCLGDMKKAIEQFEECKRLVDKGAEDLEDINSKIIVCINSIDKNSNLYKSEEHCKLCLDYYEKKEYEKSVEHAVIALKYKPQNVLTIILLAEALFGLGREEEGFATAVDGINICKRDHSKEGLDVLYYNVGNYYSRKEDYENAVKQYLLATVYNPLDKDYFYNLGMSYKKLKQYQNAVEAYEKGLNLDPNDKEMADQLKDCKMKLNN